MTLLAIKCFSIQYRVRYLYFLSSCAARNNLVISPVLTNPKLSYLCWRKNAENWRAHKSKFSLSRSTMSVCHSAVCPIINCFCNIFFSQGTIESKRNTFVVHVSGMLPLFILRFAKKLPPLVIKTFISSIFSRERVNSMYEERQF